MDDKIGVVLLLLLEQLDGEDQDGIRSLSTSICSSTIEKWSLRVDTL